MYKISGSYTRPRQVTGRWKKTDIPLDTKLLEIPSKYGEVVLLINVSGDSTVRSIAFDKLRLLPEYVTSPASTTLQQFFEGLGEKTLEFDKTLFTLNPVYASYRQLSITDLKIEPIDRYDNHKNVGGYSKSDLFVENIINKYKNLGEYSLFTVNGFFHLSDYDENGIYIYDGNKTIRRSNDNQVGTICFEKVGKVKQFPITSSMIASGQKDVPLKDNCFITLPKEIDVENKSFFIVIGGYLYPINDGIRRVSTRTFRLSLQRLSLIDRYYAAKDYINLDSLKLTDYEEKDEGLISLDEFYSDRVITALFTCSQSFIVTIDNPSIFFTNEPVETPFPGVALIPVTQFAHKPLMGAYGRIMEYHPVVRQERVICRCSLNLMRFYSYCHRPYRQQGSVDTKEDSFYPWTHGQYSILNIGSDRS